MISVLKLNPEINLVILLFYLLYIAINFVLLFLTIRRFLKFFIKNMISWNNFFNCYYGTSIKNLLISHNKLVKISGRCRAISINENFRKKYENFNQHFLLEIDDSKEDIDIISLKEKTNIIKYLPLVSESDEITIIGEMKSILDDENFSNGNNRIVDIILAHHVEFRK